MPAMTLAVWRAFDAQCGFGERRMDLRFAKMTAHLIAAIPFGKARAIHVDDYVLADGAAEADPGDAAMFDSFDAKMSTQRRSHGS